MKEILYPRSIRVWHWVQAIGMIVLMASGMELRFPDFVRLFPSFKVALWAHNAAGLLVAICWLAWLAINLVRGDLARQYFPRPRDLGDAAAYQIAYYAYGYFKGWKAPFHPRPEARFNPLQKAAYATVMLGMVPLQIATGILLYDIKRFAPVINALGGLLVIDSIHVFLSYALVAFLIVHLYLCTLGNTFLAHFQAMIRGYEDEPRP
jgi:thiosulfate reductase cytochrome b subunit